MSVELSIQDVLHVARLARLAMTPEQAEAYVGPMREILAYVERLEELDLDGVAPMAHPTELTNRWDADEPVSGLDVETLMRMAPDAHPPFIKAPKVLGGGGGGGDA